MTTTSTRTGPTQELNANWFFDSRYGYIRRATMKDDTGQELRDQSGNVIYNEFKFFCQYCQKEIICEKMQ